VFFSVFIDWFKWIWVISSSVCYWHQNDNYCMYDCVVFEFSPLF